ncbi:hypothetical protein [Phenylobacterium sp.]|uniref:hypothetical protein n=1 Tax=Phenylobacterium sp. TaxID=1871053 RepID=UPI00301BD96A
MPSIAALDQRCFLKTVSGGAENAAPGRAPSTLSPPTGKAAAAGLQPGPARGTAEPAAA